MRGKRETRGMMDSGANISIARRELAEKMGVKIIEYEEAVSIQFGKEGARSEAIGYANFGELIGDIAIVNDASDTLIHIKTFTDKGMRVVFDRDIVQIVDEEGITVIEGKCDESQLYYIDIEEAMKISIEYEKRKRKREETNVREENRQERDKTKSKVYTNVVEKEYARKRQKGIAVVVESDYESEEEEEDRELKDDKQEKEKEKDQDEETSINEESKGKEERGQDRRRRSVRGEKVPIEYQRYVWQLHRQCNHMSENVMCESIQQWGGLPTWMTTVLIHRVFKRQHCIACEISKRRTLPQQIGSGIKENVVGHTLSADYVGPFTPRTLGGANGFIIFKCTACGFRTVYLVKSKTAFVTCIDKVVNWWARKGRRTRKIRVDAGTVENSMEVLEKIGEIGRKTGGLELDPAPAGQQEKNPVERDIQWIKRRIAVILMEQNALGAAHWGHALLDIVDTENMAVNSLTRELEEGMRTAYYCVYGHNPSMENRKYTWGQLVTVQKQKTIQMEAKNEIGAAVGVAEGEGGGVRVVLAGKGMKAYIRYQVKALKILTKELTAIEKEEIDMKEVTDETGKIIETKYQSHVEKGAIDKIMIEIVNIKMREEEKIDDNIQEKEERQGNEEEEEKEEWKEDIEGWSGIVRHEEGEEKDEEEKNEEERKEEGEKGEEKNTNKKSGEQEEENVDQVDTEEREEGKFTKNWKDYTREEIDESVRTRADRARRSRIVGTSVKGIEISEINRKSSTRGDKRKREEEEEESIIKEAIERLDTMRGERRVNKVRIRTQMNPTIEYAVEHEWEIWREAVEKEMANLLHKDVSEEIREEEVPEGAYIVKTMVDLTTKMNKKTGEILKRKCRINARGDLEKRRHKERGEVVTYSPTARQQTIMMMIALGAYKGEQGYKLSGWDAEAAFLQTPVKRDIYIEFPKQLSGGKRRILKMKRMMYGLDDASREWFNFVKETLVENEYKQCINDPCAFVKREEKEVCIVAVHVDDGTDLCNSERLSQELYRILGRKFKITKQDCLEIQLGMTLEYNENGSITVKMPVHLRKVIEEVYPEGREIPIITSPMSEKWDEEYQRGAERCDIEIWMMILGMVVWILRVRLDIACAVSILCSRTQEATTRDMEELERLVAYLAFTEKIGVTFHPEEIDEDKSKEWVEQTGYADAAARAYKKDSQAQNGIATKLGGHDSKSGMYMGSSAKNKSMVPLASTGAELAAAVEEVKDIIWSREMLKEWGFNCEEATNVATKVMEDNKSLITVANDYSKGSKRMRQSLNLVHFLMDNIQRKNIEFVWLIGMEHPTDGMSKPVRPKIHWRHMSKLMGEHPDIEDARRRAGQGEGQQTVKSEGYRKVNCAVYEEARQRQIANERREYETERNRIFINMQKVSRG